MTDLIAQLEELGYVLSVDGSALRVRFAGNGSPPFEVAKPLLGQLGAAKADALALLSHRTATYATVQQCRELRGTTEHFSSDAVCNGQTTVQQLDREQPTGERCTTVAATVAEAESEKVSVPPSISHDCCSVAPLQDVFARVNESVSQEQQRRPASSVRPSASVQDRVKDAGSNIAEQTVQALIVRVCPPCPRCGQPQRVHCRYVGHPGLWLAWCDSNGCAGSADVVDARDSRLVEVAW
jgi:hypothetical protein